MAETTKTSSGVQELIDRIRDQGVQAAQEEADRLLRHARQQASRDRRPGEGRGRGRASKGPGGDRSLPPGVDRGSQARRAGYGLGPQGARHVSVRGVREALVISATRDKELVRSIVLVLAGHAADEFIKDKEIEVRISSSLLEGQTGPVFKEEGKLAILGLSSDMLREGLELVSDSEIEGGARVRLVQDKLEIDLSDRAIARMISQRLLPRFKAILEGAE